MLFRHRKKVAGPFIAALVLAAGPMGNAAASDLVDIRFTLNWTWQGPQAWFFIADDKGWFAEEGVRVHFDQGAGSGAAVTRVAGGAYDAGFGDINALIDFNAQHPDSGMRAVYMIFNVSSFVIVSQAKTGIIEPRDLEGRVLGAGADDAAFKLFPAFAAINGIDASTITWQHMTPPLRQQLLVRGDIDGAAGFYITVKYGLKQMGFDPEQANFMRYADYGMPLYGNTVLFSGKFINENPEAVRGFLRALNRAFFHVLDYPSEGIDAVMKREPLLTRSIEEEQLRDTVVDEIVTPEMREIGMGAVDMERLERAIAIVADGFSLARRPEPTEIFDPSFLPPVEERMLRADWSYPSQ